jgi:hypothetical protein
LGTGTLRTDANPERPFVQVLVEKQAATQRRRSGVQNRCCLSSDISTNRSQDHEETAKMEFGVLIIKIMQYQENAI